MNIPKIIFKQDKKISSELTIYSKIKRLETEWKTQENRILSQISRISSLSWKEKKLSA